MLGRHLLGYLPVQAAQALTGFGAVAVFTRLMTPEDYGRYALALAALSITHMLAFTWLEAAVARFHARAETRGRIADHLATAYGLYALAALAALITAGGALFFLPFDPRLQAALAFALCQLIVRSLMQIGLETHRAGRDVGRYSALEASYLTLSFLIGAGLLMITDLGAAGPFAGAAIAALVLTVIDLPVMLRRARGGKRQQARAASYAKYGAPLSVSLLFEHLLSIGDRFLIAALLGSSAVGMYAAGYGLADRLLDVIFIWFGAAVWPLTLKAFESEGREAARAMMAQAAGLMGLVAFPAAAGLALVAPEIAGLIIGPGLRAEAAMIMPWIALSGLMNGMMTYYFHEAFTLKRRTGVMAATMALAAALNLGLNLLLLPVFGLAGAAMATVIAYGLALIACAILGRRFFPMPLPWAEWLKAGLATAAMSALVFALPDEGPAWILLGLKAGAGAAAYAVLALALNIAGCRAWLRMGPNFKPLEGAR